MEYPLIYNPSQKRQKEKVEAGRLAALSPSNKRRVGVKSHLVYVNFAQGAQLPSDRFVFRRSSFSVCQQNAQFLLVLCRSCWTSSK